MISINILIIIIIIIIIIVIITISTIFNWALPSQTPIISQLFCKGERRKNGPQMNNLYKRINSLQSRLTVTSPNVRIIKTSSNFKFDLLFNLNRMGRAESFCAGWWKLWLGKYREKWVGFRNTDCPIVLSTCLKHLTSRNVSFLLASSSMVNLRASEEEFKGDTNSCSCSNT